MTSLKQSKRCSSCLTCWYPLLPTFSARIILSLRHLIGIACCATFTLSPVTSELLQSQLLLSVGFIVALKNTLGSTIQAAYRVFLAGLISAVYCLCIVNFCHKDMYFAVGATNIFVLIIVYTDLPAPVRRYSMLPTCIILLQWFKKPHIDSIYILHTWASLSIGGLLAIIVSCIPLPVFPTAYRELTIHDFHNYSTSFENLKDDYLLKSDIQDLHSLINNEIKEIERALTEISYEPYFMLLNIFHTIPFLKRFVKKPVKLQSRLKMWSQGFASIQRTITGILSLDHHHHSFVGQRQLISAISCLLDSTFNLLDTTLPYAISTKDCINPAQIISCRAKVEEALEHFFESYAQIWENPNQKIMSNTDLMCLNTFLLLILRLVHATITVAETSEIPGTCLDNDLEQIINNSTKSKLTTNWKKPFYHLAKYIGLKPSFGKFVRAIKTSLSVLISAIIVLKFAQRLQAYGWVYWAPMTTALVSDSSEGGTLRLSFQRLMAVLLGSTYAYIIFLVAQDHLTVGIFISLFVAFMGYIKTDPQKEYFASVCAQSASIITFISNQEGLQGSNKAVLARTSLTFLGIFIHVLISNLILPISARGLIKKKVSIMINSVSLGLKSVTDDFCSFIRSSTPSSSIDEQTSLSNLMNELLETERLADDFPNLLEEALSEPNFWKRPFVEVKDRYDDISKTLKRIILNIRFIHRCTTILKAERKLHFAQEAKWQIRRASLIPQNHTQIKSSHQWTMTELRKHKQLQNDLDIPLTVFMTYTPRTPGHFERTSLISNISSTSFRINNITSYQPVIEHIYTLEKSIQQVLSLTGQLIEKHTTVDVGSFQLQEFYRNDDSFDNNEQQTNNFKRRQSFYPVRQFETISIPIYDLNYFSCCHINKPTDNQPLPSLRNAVDLMFASLIQFLYANNKFIRTELISVQSIGDILAFHTLSYAFKDMVEATTDLAKNARRIKHINTRTLTCTEYEDKTA